MTADWAKIDFNVLETISNRVVNECKGINRVVYDITSKPPGIFNYFLFLNFRYYRMGMKTKIGSNNNN